MVCNNIPLYDNKYSLIIDKYFYETSIQTSSACALSHLLDTLSDILDKCLRFSLIKIESVSIKEKRKHKSKMLDRVSKRWERAQALEIWIEKVS
jgi:hypothetical protein